MGAVASIMTLLALTKGIATIADTLLRNLHNAPKELAQVCNQVAFIFLELECIGKLQDDQDTSHLLIDDEFWILKQALTITLNEITAIQTRCNKYIKVKTRLQSRVSWAFFDSKTIDCSLVQLRRTESHLLFVTHRIATRVQHIRDQSLC